MLASDTARRALGTATGASLDQLILLLPRLPNKGLQGTPGCTLFRNFRLSRAPGAPEAGTLGFRKT